MGFESAENRSAIPIAGNPVQTIADSVAHKVFVTFRRRLIFFNPRRNFDQEARS
jgi:hypothetical protein